MIRVEDADKINEFELIIVMDKLKENGVEYATIRPGNKCLWVSHGLIESYYIFSKGRLVDIQID